MTTTLLAEHVLTAALEARSVAVSDIQAAIASLHDEPLSPSQSLLTAATNVLTAWDSLAKWEVMELAIAGLRAEVRGISG